MKVKRKSLRRQRSIKEGSEDKLLSDEDATKRGSQPNESNAAKQKKALKVLKIVLPHLGLTLFIAGYIFVGAAIFQAIETTNDLELLTDRAQKIATKYQEIAAKVQDMCKLDKNDLMWKRTLFDKLSLISEAHEKRPYKVDPETPLNVNHLIKPRWAYLDGFLYSLSILTTTGYTNATPLTNFGQITAIIYGLLGIPLMVLTAVDMGRFLSDVVMIAYGKVAPRWNKFMRLCGCLAEAAKRKVSSTTKVQTILDQVESAGGKNLKGSKKNRVKPKLPLWANFSILLLFNTLGAFLYMAHGETKPDFLEGFFVCFNLVANLTMGEIPVVSDIVMVIYIAFFVTFGLAVLSMCADLAASELKWLFLKIHYFGRRIRQKRKLLAELQQVVPFVEDVEVKELLKIIDEIRKRYPSQHKITHQDILDFIQNNYEDPGDYSMSRRRDTIAFMPEGMDVLKFADADDIDEASMRIIPSNPEIEIGSDDIEFA